MMAAASLGTHSRNLLFGFCLLSYSPARLYFYKLKKSFVLRQAERWILEIVVFYPKTEKLLSMLISRNRE